MAISGNIYLEIEVFWILIALLKTKYQPKVIY